MRNSYLPLLLLTACTAPEWRAYEIDQHLTVSLPQPPQPVNLPGMRFASPATQQTANSAEVRALTATDGANVYGIIHNAAALPADIAVVADSFYNQGIRNVLQREHRRLLKRSTFATPAGQGVEVKFGGPVRATADSAAVQYVRTVLVDWASYTFIFQPYEEKSTSEQRRRFFDSITLKP